MKRAVEKQSRTYAQDCVAQMEMLRSHPDVLANALREMGVTESGDEVRDDE